MLGPEDDGEDIDDIIRKIEREFLSNRLVRKTI